MKVIPTNRNKVLILSGILILVCFLWIAFSHCLLHFLFVVLSGSAMASSIKTSVLQIILQLY